MVCDVATPFPSTSYIPSSTTPTQTLSTTLPSTACGPQVQAEGYVYRSCGDVCLSTSDFCCGFIPDTNLAYSCGIGEACLLSGNANTPMCCDASGYSLEVSPFAASNATETSTSLQLTGITSTIFPSTQTTSSSSVATSRTPHQRQIERFAVSYTNL